MGDGARPDPAPARPEPGGVAGGNRKRAINFARLMPSTAERVVSFWQTRQPEFASRQPSRSGAVDETANRSREAFALGLAAVARHGVAAPRLAPVVRVLRGPDEIRRRAKCARVQPL